MCQTNGKPPNQTKPNQTNPSPHTSPRSLLRRCGERGSGVRPCACVKEVSSAGGHRQATVTSLSDFANLHWPVCKLGCTEWQLICWICQSRSVHQSSKRFGKGFPSSSNDAGGRASLIGHRSSVTHTHIRRSSLWISPRRNWNQKLGAGSWGQREQFPRTRGCCGIILSLNHQAVDESLIVPYA